MKDTMNKIKNFAIRNIHILLAVVLVAFVAIIVVILLNANAKKGEVQLAAAEPVAEEIVEETPAIVEIPLEENVDSSVNDLMEEYYRCISEGDIEKLLTLCDVIEDKEQIRFEEQSKYLSYQIKEIYKQDGPVEGSSVVYVYCDVFFDAYPDLSLPAYSGFYIKPADDGSLIIIKGELTSEENDYISQIASQDDVVELNNRVTVEYNDIVVEHPEMLTYLGELDSLVNTAVGEKLAAMSAPEESEVAEVDQTGETPAEGGDTATETDTTEVVDAGPKYATATTTVNVRKSDSENADKLGKVSSGTKLEVIENQLNGWTKIVYDGQTGFIKSEFLSMVETVGDLTAIGKVTAISNVNVRISPDETAERLGILTGGDTVDLFTESNGWCKILYQGQVGYVKSDYVQKQ